MSVSPINAAGSATTNSLSLNLGNRSVDSAQGESKGGNNFAKLLESANNQQIEADQAVQQLANGEAPSMHNVVLSAAKADLSFRLVLEMRNKLIESYQEIMRMQV